MLDYLGASLNQSSLLSRCFSLVFLPLFISLSSVQSSVVLAHGDGQNSFPTSPDPQLTPGAYCGGSGAKRNPNRDPKKVVICARSVSSARKNGVISHYDELRGYSIGSMDRKDFKIDHFIPLCIGGANEEENLWPQHQSVYVITDPIEHKTCESMRAGKITQDEAVEFVKRGKLDLGAAPDILKYLESL